MENSTKFAIGGVLVAIVIAIGALLTAQNALSVAAQVGSTGTRFPNGISADTTSPLAGQVRGTSSLFTNTATTTLKLVSQTANVGACIQVNGTSSATTIKYEATSTGPLIGLYGTCP